MLKTTSRLLCSTSSSFTPLPLPQALAKLQEISQKMISSAEKKEQYRLLAMQQAPGLSPYSSARKWAVLALNDRNASPDIAQACLARAFQDTWQPLPANSNSLFNEQIKKAQSITPQIRNWTSYLKSTLRLAFFPQGSETAHPEGTSAQLAIPAAASEPISKKIDQEVEFTWVTGKEYGEAFLAGQVPGHVQQNNKTGVKIWTSSALLELKPSVDHFQTPALIRGKAPASILEPDKTLPTRSNFLPSQSVHRLSQVQVTPLPLVTPDDVVATHPELQCPFYRESLDKFNPETDVRLASPDLNDNLTYYYEILVIPPIPRKETQNGALSDWDWETASRQISQDPVMGVCIQRFMERKFIEESFYRDCPRRRENVGLNNILKKYSQSVIGGNLVITFSANP